MEVWVVVDHLSGSRRGQRQEFELSDKLRIGRHPDCDIGFDARRDLEASTRHAELRVSGDELRLCDVGSSNGTYVGGERVHEATIPRAESFEAQFGARGPRLRIWWAPEPDPDAVPPLPGTARSRARAWLIAAAVILLAVALALLLGR